jgi:putative peptidoglycan lipid II flippase
VRQILATRAFGTTSTMDAFNTASIFPDLLFNLLAGGALASAFVPTFTAFLVKDDHPSAWRLASAIANLVVLLLTTLSFVSSLFANQIAQLLDPHSPLAQQQLIAHLLRILLITSTVFGVSGLLSGILNAHQRFWLPSLASAIYWVGIIIGLLFFVPKLGIYGMAWGVVLGACLHLCIQLPDLFRLPERHYTPTLGIGNPSVREVIVLMGPRLISVATLQLNFVVTTIIANSLPTGSLSAIKFAFPIMTVPLVIIGSGIGFATLPTFSAQVARGEIAELKGSITSALRGVLFLSVPATFGLILLAPSLISAMYQYGKFSGQNTGWVAWALILYTIGLVGHATLEVVVRAFYALHDTKTPVLVGATAMTINLILSILLVILFNKIGWIALGGLALSTSIAAYLETGILFALLRKRLKGIQGKQLATGTTAAILGSLAMSVIIILWTHLMGTHSPVLITLGGVVVGGAVYGLVLILLRVPEINSLFQWIKRRLSKKVPQP